MKSINTVTLLIFFASIFKIEGQSKCPILPSPMVYVSKSDYTNFSKIISVNPSNLNSNLKSQLQEFGKTYHSINFIEDTITPNLIFKKLINVVQDSYSINVNENITISFSSEKSCFYAILTLMQLIEEKNNEIQIQNCFVQDYPKFQWRGLHLDVARHFYTVDEVKKFIDLMSIYKFNTFHWHLTDDQGWRIEIKKYPKLTEIGAWRDSTVENHYSTSPRTYERKRSGGYYTQEQIKEIVNYASTKYITVVPEIEMPGHARAALAAYPEFSCTEKQQGVEGLWGVFDDIFCSKTESINFLQDILSEVIELFPGEYIHIGGDEAPKTRWQKCSKCQEIIKENSLKNEHELQSYFIGQMDVFLSSKGKKIIGWDEILEGGLSPNAAVMSWRGYEGGIEAAKQGHYVIMTPGSHCYFDHYQGRGKDEPLAIGGFTPLEKVYGFNPIPSILNTSEASFILGAQANLWTEYIADFDKLMYMAYPRAIALSQVLWNDKKPTFESFQKILVENHFPFLDKIGVNYSKTILKPKITQKRTNEGIEIKAESQDKTEIKSIIRIKKGIELDTVKFENKLLPPIQISNSKALGAKIEYITKPNKRYDNGDLILVDGQFGSRPWKGNEWIGFDTSVIIIEIELEKKQKINEVEISFLNDVNSWIHLPNTFTVETVGLRKDHGFGKSDFENSEKRSFKELNIKAKRLRFTIYCDEIIPENLPGAGNKPWTFIDEIIVK